METFAFAFVALLLLLLVVLLAAIVYQLVRQQGSALLRIEILEQRLGELASAAAAVEVSPQGLPAGTVVEPFHLPDFVGRLYGLADFSGRRLLVHWSPDCGFCELIASELGRLHPSLREHDIELVLISWGDVDSNRTFANEHGLGCRILLQDGSPPLAAFAGLGTPVAYLLDEEARTVGPVVVGADAVLELARDLAHGRTQLASERSLSESRLERTGLKAGEAAPSFSLPGLDDRPVALEDFRGRPLLLVFSDPDCGPCNALAPELARFHREQGAGRLEFVMVSRGDRLENARKADEQGIEFPVALQPGWRLSKEFGIFETPVAFLIDEHGQIAKDVARGSEQILALAAETLAGRREVNERETIGVAH